MQKQNRIRFKNIEIEYKALDCELVTIKAFFIGLFKTKYSKVKIKYLCIGKVKKNIKILLQLDTTPDWRNTQNFRFQEIIPSFENCLSSVDLYEELVLNNYLEHGQHDFILDISRLKNSEQDKRFEHFLRGLLGEHKQSSFTYEEVLEQSWQYLERYKHYLQFDKDKVIRKIVSAFEFKTNNLEDETIKDLTTFKKDIKEINDLNQAILNGLEKLKQEGRTYFISVEGAGNIGKTQLVKAILKYYQIPFNYRHGNLNFSKSGESPYNDKALVDILDDINAFKISKDNMNLEESFVKNIIGGNFKDTTVPTAKFERHRTLKNNKLVIIICNPGKGSFSDWAQNDKNPDKEYIESRQGVYIYFLDNEPLYKIEKKEQEENIGHE